ncbi:GAF domain-containing protein [Kribbella sp. NPDC048928]|uniref:GAF domain-containing sensor histidine kinase n=1 Tax=Kribbella sp. NPDC048928 TaxID=3364111 RepID=UPI00370F7D07
MAGDSRAGRGTWDEGALEYAGLSRVRLDALLQELLGRVHEIMEYQDRLRALLDAVVGIGADLDLNSTLDRIVGTACELADSRYGALGVVGPDGKRLVRFITHGVSDDEIAAIGPYPEGHGILGLLIEHPEPIRMHDLAEHPRSYGFPSNHPPMKSFLGVPIRTREHVYGNLYLTEKTGGADFTEDDERTVTALAAAAGVVIDNARLYADTEQRRRSHEVTAEITQLMLGEFDADQALQLIAQRCREISRAQVSGVLITDGDELVVRAIDGPADYGRYVGRRLPAGLPVLGQVVPNDGQVIVLEDLAQVLKDSGGLTDFPEGSALGRTTIAPLPAGGAGTGGFVVVALEQGASNRVTEGADLVRMFAGQATLALERAQAQRDRDALAVLEDRDRIARDLHDLVIQRLFATGLQLQGMHRLARPEHQDRLSRAVDDIDTTIHDLRAAIFELQHGPESTSLRGDLQTMVSEYAEALGFRPRLTCTGPVDTAVPAEIRPQLLAAVRESLSNVVRHAHASQATVEVTVGSGVVVTRVADDGVGIGATNRRSGLRNLAERAEALGGTLSIINNDPHGTVVELTAPTD